MKRKTNNISKEEAALEKLKKYIWPLSIMAIVISFDQWLKFWVKANMDYVFNSRGLPNQIPMIGDWFKLNFVENNGMAFGMELGGGDVGKIVLTLFRCVAVIAGLIYLVRIVRRGDNKWLIACVSLIIAGALGNIIDSVFYGVWFSDINEYTGGYFHGQVVDMLYFPLFTIDIGNEPYTFFSAIFNVADSAISVGVIALIIFQNKFFAKPVNEEAEGEQSEESVEGESINPPSENIQTDHTSPGPVPGVE